MIITLKKISDKAATALVFLGIAVFELAKMLSVVSIVLIVGNLLTRYAIIGTGLMMPANLGWAGDFFVYGVLGLGIICVAIMALTMILKISAQVLFEMWWEAERVVDKIRERKTAKQ